jgi:transcription elongation factor Elf1
MALFLFKHWFLTGAFSMPKGGCLENVKQLKAWFYCPNCGQKLLRYDKSKGTSKQLYIKCKKCRREVEIKIE